MPKWLFPVLAQEQYDHRAKQKGRKSCLTPKLKKEMENGLKSSWSPEQICGRYQLEQKQMVAFKTIYNWALCWFDWSGFKRPSS